jgi:hypothetical protein
MHSSVAVGLHPPLLGLNDNGGMHIPPIGYEKSGVLLLSRLLLLCHATHRTSDSLRNVSFVESL